MNTERNTRTSGHGFLTIEEQQRMQRELRAQGAHFRLSGKGADEEITLLKISATGAIPAAIKAILQAFNVGISA